MEAKIGTKLPEDKGHLGLGEALGGKGESFSYREHNPADTLILGFYHPKW